MATPAPDLARLLTATDGSPLLTGQLGPSTLPLALLPVRLETRFVTEADGSVHLWVRVYPDALHLDAHDPLLSADEIARGKAFWTGTSQAGSDDVTRRTAWRQLATRFGPNRAAWVARALTPTGPPGNLAFPDIGPPATRVRTPVARLLPQHWVATAYVDGAVAAVVTGRDITHDLPVGPDADRARPPETIGDDESAIDDGMRWMVELAAAEEAGMALRLPLAAGRVDVLLVVGVRSGDDGPALARQLEAHHHSDGLVFVPVGTPTNSTGAHRTGAGAPDPTFSSSYDSEWLSGPLPTGSAALARTALGVDVFDHLAGAAADDASTSAAVQTALWPATWGYFLAQMIGWDGPLTPQARDWARRHALDHLRPGGPLPLLQCGSQPYGLLPVTSLDRWTAATGDVEAQALQRLLVSLRDSFWRPAAGSATRVGRSDDAGSDLVAVLSEGARTTAYAARRLMGQHFLQHLRSFLGEDLDQTGFWSRLVQLAGDGGLGFTPALAHAAYEPDAHPLAVPLVGDPARLHALAGATADEALAEVAGASLLEVLARHALLRQHVEEAARVLDAPATPFPQLVRDAELVDLVPGLAPTPTWSWLRSRPVAGHTVADEVQAHPGPELTELRQALEHLAGADAGALERHLTSTLDAASHRLDAWTTSLATKRLAELRAGAPTGVVVGGYGWLEDLTAATPGALADPVPDEPGPLTLVAGDPGFVHAPSLNQASLAALLRDAHLAHGATADSPYAVDLSSARTRIALQLLDGVRAGQPLGALLGYRCERALHEAGLDPFVDPLRSLDPLAGAEGLRLVVDGLALSRRWADDPGSVLTALGVTTTDPRLKGLTTVLDDLAGAIDATADALTAESAFQLVRGSTARAAATLDAVASGQTPPPELGFVRTPRTGVAVTHRVVALLSAVDDRGDDGWARSTPRANADPVLAAWAARVLGPAQAVLRVNGHPVALGALGLAAIDLVWASRGVEGDPPELLPLALGALGDQVDATSASLDSSELADQLELAVRAHRLLAGARPADGADLQPPHADPERGLDAAELHGRATAAEQALRSARAALVAATDDAGLRAALLAVAAFGVPGAVPIPGAPLAVQAGALLPDLDRRLAGLDAADGTDGAARLRAVFGPGFLALPRFTAPTAPDVTASLADAPSLLGGDLLAAHTWLTRMERVREPLARLTRVAREVEVVHGHDLLGVTVAQVPHVAGQRWVGLPQTGLAEGCVSLVLAGAPADLSTSLCGLVVDEWTEVVPQRTETTGIAFRGSPPTSSAPQAVLLAVPPVTGEPWRLETLNRVLLETFESARLRVLRPSALAAVGHFLPATHLAFNTDGDAVSTDLHPVPAAG